MRKKILPNLMYLLVFAICFSFFVSSCQKMDITNANLKVVERFFKVPADANPILIRIINDLKESEFNKPFISNFVKSEGLPIWEHAKITIKQKVKSKDGNPDTLVIIPIIPDDGLYVKDILAVKITTELLYKLYEREAYASYGFDRDPYRTSPNADDLATQIINLEKELFSAEAYIIKDNRLFDYWPSNEVKPESFFMKASISISHQVPTYNGGGEGPCTMYAVFADGHLAYYYTTGWCDNGGIPPGGGAGGGLDGGPGWTDSPPTSGGGGSTSSVPPCGSGFERVVITPDGLYSGPCTSPTQVPTDSLPNVDPCILLTNKARGLDTIYVNAKIDSILSLIPNISNEVNEKGFLIFQKFTINPYNVNDTTFNGYLTSSIFNGTDSSIEISYGIPSRSVVRIFLHTHTPKHYNAQSAGDIYSLIEDILDNPYQVGNLVASADGHKYAIIITDISKAMQFINTKNQYLNGEKWREESDIGMAFEKAKLSFENKYKNDVNKNDIAYEMALSSVLKQFNVGITLFKRNSMGNFIPIVINTIHDPHKPKRIIYAQDCQ